MENPSFGESIVNIILFLGDPLSKSKYPNGSMVYNGQSAKNMDDE
jgi:hypothetical protein